MEIDKKLEVYLCKNNWCQKKYFTTKSLFTIAGCYQHSRMGNGMSCFMDKAEIIETLRRII